ncbi:hypothetical protein D3C74_58560 [compost metagenome]
MSNRVHDNIIRDLLPLYVDGVCSLESEELVEKQLQASPELREELAQLRADLRLSLEANKPYRQDAEVIRKISVSWSRSKWTSFVKGTLLSLSVCSVLLLGYIGLFRWNVIPVSSQVIAITDLGQLDNGRIAYHVTLTDGFDSNRAKYEMDEDGNFYVIPYRPVFPTKAKADIAIRYYEAIDHELQIYKQRYGEDREITALYYGRPDDSVLVWEKGMKLPPASDKARAWFQE